MKRLPKISPEEISLTAIWWEDVIRRTRQPLDLRSATVLTLGAVVYEDDDLIVVAQEIDPDEKHWLKSEMDQVRIPKRLVLNRLEVGKIPVHLPEAEEASVESEEEEAGIGTGTTGLP